MIITHLKASNILKYEQLDLNVPQQGLIAISGKNESGKSSIGEAVCFALFGRTFSIGPADLQKVVRWGENHCAVTLGFEVAGQAYELSRFLDRDGNHSAKLSRPGEDEPLARGVAHVAEALSALLGFEYEQFVESFYLAQREITTPHPHSQAVKIMAGMAPLEKVVREINNEIAERNELLEEVQAEYETIEHELDELGIQEGLLGNLESDRLDTVDQADRVRVLGEEMAAGLDTYCANTHSIYSAESARGHAGFLRFVFFLLALAAGAVWWLLSHGADMPLAAGLRDLLDSYLPQWQQVPVTWIGYGAAASFVLFLLMWMRAGAKNARVRHLRQKSGALADVLIQAREIDVEFAEAETQAEEPEASAEHLDGAGEEVEDLETDEMPVRPSQEEFDGIREKVASGEATARQVRDYTERELAWLIYVGELLSTEVSQLEDAIGDEQTRLHEAEGLREILAGMREKRTEDVGRIELRRKALELLQGAISQLSNHFNRDIRELVGRMLPLFTDARYEHLQIDEDLRVRVFSNQKRDFMDLEEVSSGTQRQIMLALRLALSQKLLSRAIKGKQFTFLDEPFAFFDEERTRKALNALTNLGDDVSQVWIVAQSFPQNCVVPFSAKLECQREQSRLELAAQ